MYIHVFSALSLYQFKLLYKRKQLARARVDIKNAFLKR